MVGQEQIAPSLGKANVIVIMLDSLQFNYLGCYGNKWIRTPNIDCLAREGTLFENNYIDNLPTVPCRRSMHTGRYSLHWKGWTPLELEETTIADLCWGRPIDSALIFDCPMYRLPKFGYTRGFDKVWFLHGHEADQEYYAKDPLIHLQPEQFIEDHVLAAARELRGNNVVEYWTRELSCFLRQRQYWRVEEDQNVVKVMKMAAKYLENVDRNKSFFLWVDSFDPHEPWDSPSVHDPDLECPYDPGYRGKDMFHPVMGMVNGLYTEPEMNHIRMLYAEKVTMCDRWVGYLLDRVRALGLEDNTLIMLVSDHGEPMGNGAHGHGIMRKCRPWPYEELAHAPMIIKGPGLPAGRRVKAFTQSCDVAPTVTDWLGIGAHSSHTGKSLLPLAKGEVDRIRNFAVAGYTNYSWAIYTHDWSFIHWRRPGDKLGGPGNEQIVGAEMAKAVSTLGIRREGGAVSLSEAEKLLREAATLDGEDQWTCTPSALAEVPQDDELYDRPADPFQLNNIAKRDPRRASELYGRLREFMAELRTT